jgi:hypothetical protein
MERRRGGRITAADEAPAGILGLMPRSSTGAAGRTRAMACLLVLAALLTCAGLTAGSAWAAAPEGSSLQQLAEEESQTATSTTATTSTSSTSSETGNSHTTILLVAAAAVLLLAGIAVVIVRDARRVAPATDPEIVEARAGRDTAVTLRKRRAKAKAARKQRKRSR